MCSLSRISGSFPLAGYILTEKLQRIPEYCAKASDIQAILFAEVEATATLAAMRMNEVMGFHGGKVAYVEGLCKGNKVDISACGGISGAPLYVLTRRVEEEGEVEGEVVATEEGEATQSDVLRPVAVLCGTNWEVPKRDARRFAISFLNPLLFRKGKGGPPPLDGPINLLIPLATGEFREFYRRHVAEFARAQAPTEVEEFLSHQFE